jgi:4-hydroxy-3-methylbut-2-enyl diphosphate reductase
MDEARPVLDFIERSGDSSVLAAKFAKATSPGFDFAHDLERVGIANQTTMLSGESLAIAAEFGRSMARRYGEENLAAHFRSFDTICSATQERQDAIRDLLAEAPDVMLVIGGYNSSNTCHLAELSESLGVRTYHIEDADCVDPGAGTIRHQPVGSKHEMVTDGWIAGATRFGITAGASTPNNKIGETVARVCETAGVSEALRSALAA